MALTRILRGASSSANPLVRVSMAPFVEAYSRAPGTGCEPAVELRVMMLPPAAPKRLMASCTVRIAPRTLIDRKRVGWAKRVDLGGRGVVKKKNEKSSGG